jgi:uncharacterized spore protein YtfJ
MSSLSLLQSLQEGISQKSGVKSVFGDPINVGDKVVITAAKLRYGFGAGAGSGMAGDSKKGEGGAGGGGVLSKPVGIFVVGPQGARFVSTHEARRTLAVLAVGVVLGFVLRGRRRRSEGGLLRRGLALR